MKAHSKMWAFIFLYNITNPISKSLAITTTDTTLSTRYCIKCKEGSKRKARNKIINAKRRRKTICVEN